MEKVVAIIQKMAVDGDGKEVETPARGDVPLIHLKEKKASHKKGLKRNMLEVKKLKISI